MNTKARSWSRGVRIVRSAEMKGSSAHLHLLACLVQALLWSPVFSQSIALSGVVVIQNSQYETGRRIYVSDANVRAPFAKAAISDEQGTFALDFVGVPGGSPVRLSVNKPGLEVVNSKDIGQVILGRVPQVQVVMADPDKLAAAQLKYYNIATESITRSYERRMAALRNEKASLQDRLAELSKETGQQLASMAEAIDMLSKVQGEGMQHAQELALEFAATDLDNATDLYRKAFETFGRGELDSVLFILDSGKLQAEYSKLGNQKENAQRVVEVTNEGIRQLLRTYLLKVQVLETSFMFPAAIAVLDEAINVVRQQPALFDPEVMLELKLRRAVHLNEMGAYKEAETEVRLALDTSRTVLPPGHILIGDLLNRHGSILTNLERFEEAATAQRESLSIALPHFGPDAEEVADIHGCLGLALGYTSDMDGALNEGVEALRIYRLDSVRNCRDISLALFNNAILLNLIGRTDEAYAGMGEALRLAEACMAPNDPELAIFMGQYAVMLVEAGDLPSAKRLLDRCLALQLKVLGKDHPDLAITLESIGGVLVYIDPDTALLCNRRALEIRTAVFGPNDMRNAYTHVSIARLLRDRLDVDAALDHVRSGIGILALDTEQPLEERVQLAIEYSDLFSDMAKPDSALLFAQRAVEWCHGSDVAQGPGAAEALEALGNRLADVGRVDEGVELLHRSAEMHRGLSGDQGLGYANTMNSYGAVLTMAGMLDSAYRVHTTSTAVFRSMLGDSSNVVAAMDLNRLMAAALRGDPIRDVQFQLDDDSNVLEASGQSLAGAASMIHLIKAVAFEKAGMLDSAITHLSASRRTLERVFPKDHWKFARLAAYTGRVRFAQGDMESAQHEFTQALKIMRCSSAQWFLYKIELALGNKAAAIEHLAEFMRSKDPRFDVHAIDRGAARIELLALANELGREDLIEEFIAK